MTHEKKIKALIEAGEKAGEDGHADWFDQDDKRFYRRAANARDSIKLLAEIAEAATDVALGCRSLFGDEFHMKAVSDGQKEYFGRLRALLVKYKEAQDAE